MNPLTILRPCSWVCKLVALALAMVLFALERVMTSAENSYQDADSGVSSVHLRSRVLRIRKLTLTKFKTASRRSTALIIALLLVALVGGQAMASRTLATVEAETMNFSSKT